MALEITTNNVPREVIDGFTLSEKERAEFDFVDWAKVEEGTDSASFVRYRGDLLYLNDFLRDGCPSGWDGVFPDSHWSGLVVRYASPECDMVVIGRYQVRSDV